MRACIFRVKAPPTAPPSAWGYLPAHLWPPTALPLLGVRSSHSVYYERPAGVHRPQAAAWLQLFGAFSLVKIKSEGERNVHS